MQQRTSWLLTEPNRPLQQQQDELASPGPGEVVVKVAGCGVCHTDLGFYHGDVRTRAPLPLVLGHEISGTVIETGEGTENWADKAVLVAAVIPCGECDFCRSGRGNICFKQVMPGNDADGGFATHVRVRGTGLTEIAAMPDGYQLADFSVIADAVTTPLQAIRRADVGADDFVVVIGAGGVGTYSVQIAAAAGATVVAVDINADRLAPLESHGAAATVDASTGDMRATRDAVRAIAKEAGVPRAGWKIFECSGTTAGQESAWSLLGPAATLAIVGFTRDPATVRVSNLMAFDATAFGSWGCPPELYPEAVELVRSGQVDVRPFIRHMPLNRIQEAFEITHVASEPQRIVLTPEE